MKRFLGGTTLFLLMVTLTPPILARNRPIITLCTWNLEHLAAQNDTGCRPRKDADYQALRRFTAALKADIIAFQEVENFQAAHRVFDPSTYRVEISNRPGIDLGRCRKKNQKRLMQRTGFAIRKDLHEKLGVSIRRLPDVQSLAGKPSERWGVHILLDYGHGVETSTAVHLLSVHLKSGCSYQAVRYANDDSPCSRLAAQVPRLEAWMDARAADGEEFIVLGDMNRQLDALGDTVWEALDDSETCIWEKPSSGLWVCRKGSVRYSRIADLERARAGRKHPYPRHPRHPFAVDHIIMSAGADGMAIEKTAQFVSDRQKLSDHTPLMMRFDISRGLLTSGLRWFRCAAEYKVLALSVYRRATDRMNQIAAERPETPVPWVVVMDADETIIDNSSEAAARQRYHEHFSKKKWDAWTKRAEATAIPGAMAFINAVYDAGGKIAIITNRPRPANAPAGHSDTITRATWKNLVKLGMPDDPSRICLLTRRPADRLKNINENEVKTYGYQNNKDHRRRLLAEGKAEDCWVGLGHAAEQSWRRPHDIVLQIGDNVQDFAGVTQDEAANAPDAVVRRIGTDFFLLPNPLYGSWQK